MNWSRAIRSVWQSPTPTMRTSTSSGRGASSATVSTVNGPSGVRATAALICMRVLLPAAAAVVAGVLAHVLVRRGAGGLLEHAAEMRGGQAGDGGHLLEGVVAFRLVADHRHEVVQAV